MKNIEYADQHFIPEAYLKNFTKNSKQIFIYDKKVQGSFSNSISSIANKKFFYDIPKKYIKSLFDPDIYSKYFEKRFSSEIEPAYARILNVVIGKGNNWILKNNFEGVLSVEQKYLLATHIAIQYLRMPNIRYKYLDLDKKLNQERLELIKAFVASSNSNEKAFIKTIKMDYDDNFAPVLHADIFANEELIKAITNCIMGKVWVYNIALNADFYTSDNPVLIKPHVSNQRPFYEGFGMLGSEVIFPIGSSVLLTLWDKAYFSDKSNSDNKFNQLSTKSIREYNLYQYIFATQQIYSESNNFDLITLFKRVNGGKEIFRDFSKVLINGK
jgi:hypothetical protein